MKKCVVLAAMLVAGLGLAAGEWVVDPYRAVDAKWQKHYQKGKPRERGAFRRRR